MAKGYGEIRAWGRLLIPHFVNQGLGANAIIREIKKAMGGKGWRRSVMLADIREAMGVMRLENQVRSLAPDRIPSKRVMVETDLRRARKYRVFGEVEYENEATGEVEKKKVSFYTDELKPKEQWINDFIDMKRQSEYRPEWSINTMDIIAIEHNKGFTY